MIMAASVLLLTACQPTALEPKPVAPIQAANSPSSGETGKLAMSFNLGANDVISADDFIEVKNFHTQAAIADIAKVQVKVSSEKFASISRDIERNDLNTGKTLVIKDLPTGIVKVTVTLLDQTNKTLTTGHQLIKVVANQVVPVNFDLTLDGNASDLGNNLGQTGGLAISINVKEETRLFGAIEASKSVVNVGESVQIRVKDTEGPVSHYQFDTADERDVQLTSQSTLTYQFSEPGCYAVQAVLLNDEPSFQTKATATKTGSAYTTEPYTIVVQGKQNSWPTVDKVVNNQALQMIKKVSENPLFELLKNSDPQNELQILNRQMGRAIKKGTLKGITVLGKAVNVAEIYNEWANGLNNINGLDAIDSDLSVSATDRTRLKALLALEIFIRYFGKDVVAGGAVSEGLFRRTAMDFLNHNQRINEALEDYSKVNLVVRSAFGIGFARFKEANVFVKLVPVKIRESKPGHAYFEWPITDNPSPKYIKSGVTDKNGLVKLTNVPPGLWVATLEKNLKKTTTHWIRVEPNSATNFGAITHVLNMTN